MKPEKRRKILCQFVTSDDKCSPGEVWKWRVGAMDVYLEQFIKKKLENAFGPIKIYLEKLAEQKEEIEEKKKLKKILSNVYATCQKYGENGTIAGAIKSFTSDVFDETLYNDLDKNPYIFGVGNGVLELGDESTPKINLIQGFHNYRISMYTPIPYKLYDPQDPIIIYIKNRINDIFLKPDKIEFIMCMAGSCLSAEQKDLFYAIMFGPGANGKST